MLLPLSSELARDQALDGLALDQTVYREGACADLAHLLKQLDAKRVLLIRDTSATDAAGITSRLDEWLSCAETTDVVEVTAPLSPSQVDFYGTECSENGCDAMVAVGGGATIDGAKLIALRASNSSPIEQLLVDGYEANRIPLIAAPTTAGSGSEATHFAVLFVGQQKYSVAHPSLRPRWAVVDPMLTHTVPQRIAAAAGLDVLCQAIESLWSVNSDAKSRAFATESLRHVVPNLHAAVIGQDSNAQARLALASHLAGQAINRSFTTVCHALSYPLTADYQIPHGLAAASTLPAALMINGRDVCNGTIPTDGHNEVSRCLNVLFDALRASDLEGAIAKLVQLIRSIGGAASVAELPLPYDYRPVAHAERVDPRRLENNPRKLTTEDLLKILLSRFDENGRFLWY